MEKISEEFYKGGTAPPRILFLASALELSQLPSAVSPTSPHFALFVACDASTAENSLVSSVADQLMSKGLAYVCVWGPGCERVHDVFDEERVLKNPNETSESVILTTWHSNETLQEALHFFMHSAYPAAAYEQSCRNWIAISVANPEWEQLIRTVLFSHVNECG
jgi:hypothetical protein